MHTVDYVVVGFLIACMLFAAAKALSLGDESGVKPPHGAG